MSAITVDPTLVDPLALAPAADPKIITGTAQNDILVGTTGAEVMLGGTGNDTYVVDNAGDVVTEAKGEGTDTVEASISYALADNVEVLVLTGKDAIDGTGNALDNSLTGNAAANRLDGALGADSMAGGTGDDTYVVDNADDVVIEAKAEGTDTVEASISYTLANNVEALALTGDAAINGTGNKLDNSLTGNAAANRLDGGQGADSMAGSAGDDTYVVDNAADVVTELAGEGADTVQASVSYALGDNVEALVLTGSAGINATGNALDNSLSGNGAANRLDGGQGADSMTGGAGNDSYVLDNAADIVTELANQGTDTVEASISYTLGDNVEALVLTGANAIDGTGNALNNSLTGNATANRLDGGQGADSMAGGNGNDSYVVDSASDVVTELAGEGADTVEASVSLTLSANVEALVLTGSAGINATGNTLDNSLTGNSGANLLDGGLGADSMAGSAGDDIYVVDNAADTVTELAGEGTDTVQASLSYALSDNVEALVLTGAAAIDATGNALNNTLTGNAAANRLDGALGADSMAGGAGNDTYVVDNAADLVTELAADGTDTVQASLSYTLSANVEALLLTGTNAIDATGNTLDNSLTGNAAANRLDGALGADSMTGGAGNDTYVVDNAGDTVTELVGEGTDTIQASVTYTLAANVEALVLTGTSGINATGNALDNGLTGNTGANRLDGGQGADAMTGGAGNDTYVVDNASDTVTELAGEGTDTVEASISYTLGDNVEALALTGAAAIDATGNALNNTLTGNAAANRLDGALGADSMTGGAGNDTYVVDSASDTVTELAGEGTDTVQASVTYTLSANVEALVLTGAAAINATGNTLDNSLTGNAAANRLDGGQGADSMAGSAGDDIYVVDNAGDVVTELAGEGADTVQASVSYTLAANVEALVLTGTSGINATGNALDNTLTGNTGANRLDGALGADTMTGGTGNDTYVVNDIGDVVAELTNQGTDTVETSISYVAVANLENITLTGTAALTATGNALNNVLTGNSGANLLEGLDGNDTLNGGTGADTMVGGLGNDTYTVDNLGDVVVELASEGTDTLQTIFTTTLDATLENLTLTGSAAINGYGNTADNVLTGNSGANRLEGYEGNDTLSGGSGADVLVGGLGNDTYVVDNANDQVLELADEGTDLVQASISWTLGATLENLSLTGSSGISGTGNSGANVITGNSGANRLDGALGADTMTGGSGNDTYVVNEIGDQTIENSNAGTDLVEASLNWTLAANIENLTLTGTDTLMGIGNTLDNVITGNGAYNRLYGMAGNDTLNGGTDGDEMWGGTGNDTYVVDHVWDQTFENAGEGTDWVQSSITWTLKANTENLQLTGTDFIHGFGNELDNIIIGNSNSNIIRGEAGNDSLDGGASYDWMFGGSGNDTYTVDHVWDAAIEYGNEGTDLVLSSVTYRLAAEVENLTLTGSALLDGWGNELANVLTGNGARNYLSGENGNDTILAGAGDDNLDGGMGNDNISGEDGDDFMQGGAGQDTLLGGNGADWMDAGAAADSMAGGAGNDCYVVDDASDVVAETAGQGTDWVYSWVSHTLSANVENLAIWSWDASNAIGNALDNIIFGGHGSDLVDGADGNDVLFGNEGADTILGGNGDDYLDGGTSADSMAGGAGNDTYVVDSFGDVVTEAANAGIDQVNASVSWTLGTGLERLTLTGNASDGIGNALDNIIFGNTAANTLYGSDGSDVLQGGEGNDTLDGGAGADALRGDAGHDVFRFRDLSGPDSFGGSDAVLDFRQGEDVIDLQGAWAGGVLSFLGNTGTPGQVGSFRAQLHGDSTELKFELDGDTGAEATVVLLGFTGTLSSSDFLL